MRVVNKKLWIITVTLLVVIECVFTYLSVKSYSNKDIKEIKEENKVNKEMFSMYVENKDGDYVEYTDSEYYPIGLKYYFNEERSNCTDNKGKVVSNVISYNNNKITVISNKTLFCYLYFDLDKVAPQTFTFYLGGNTNPEYITSTTTTAYLSWTDTDIESYCINTENNSSTCSWISTTGNSTTPSYTISTQGSQTRYAFIRDAAENISPVVSDEVFLDSVAPVITSASDSGSGTANVTVIETGSGVTHVCVNTSSTSTAGCVWDEVSGTTFTSTTAVTATGNYCIHVKDKAGNIGHITNAITIAKPVASLYTLCSPYTNMGTCMTNEYESAEMQEITNLGEDAGMYRYQGTYDVVDNNYICFGTNNKSTCTGNTDAYIYRIIGIKPNGQTKLIKKEALNSGVKWNDNPMDNIEWPSSDIYTTLNGNIYLLNETYVPTGWESKIATTPWKYGDTTSNGSYKGATIYATENAWTNEVSAKVGLMYIHDYYYAYASGGAPGSYSNAKTAWIHMSKNDSGALSSYEWTMSRYGYNSSGVMSYRAWEVESNGSLYNESISYVNSVRPVFYLTNDIKLSGGSGTIDNPYIIS
ncbi:MAG: hypothetical protein IJY87_04320 [Bacilli bacterium]|nr:hypothetical protein [Bacilli bacterium]